MKKRLSFCALGALLIAFSAGAQNKATITVNVNEGKQVIPKEIYGQFAEHLGTCIYGGIWVGENSPIPNTRGYRNDVLQALKALKVPVLRWPGGCFADEYHWMDGIGPKDQRPKMVNTNWGGTIEDNSFGTHEFLNLCELLETEPYISGNVGSGTVEELAKWVEYMTSDGDSPMANLRRKNGRDKAWSVKYLGVGNESWGCGGNMLPEYYADLYRRYATYCRDYDGNRLFKIASGASDYDENWTRVMMEKVGGQMHGLSLHYYTVKGWRGSKGSATQFSPAEYYWTMAKALEVEDLLKRHMDIMDKTDPRKRIALLLDEWGTWWDEEPGTVRGHLYQQNTLRDAFVAVVSLNVFHKYTDRLKMANIAQIVNVLQSMILTQEDKMLLTPTYHVFEMMNVHQDATHLPLDLQCDTLGIEIKPNIRFNEKVPVISATASRNEAGTIHLTLANVDLEKTNEVTINLTGLQAKNVTGRILTSKAIDDYNSFEKPNVIAPTNFTGAKLDKGVLTVKLPAKSIVALEVK